jgi:hypothetical protein
MMRGGTLARVALAVAGFAWLPACTPADCDPAHAEFFAGLGCSVSGSYTAREVSLRNNLAAAQAIELQRQADASRAAAEAETAQQDLARRRRQLALLDGRLRELQRQLDAASHRQGVDQAAVRDAEARLAALRAKRVQVPSQPGDAELRALEGPTQDLEKSLRQQGF